MNKMLIASLFTIAIRLKQSNYPPKDEWIKQNVVFPDEIFFSLKKECNFDTGYNLDEL